MLITTLPTVHKIEQVRDSLADPAVAGARYNVGIRGLYSPANTLSILKQEAERYGKKLWVDLKGRQLRITKWADPSYGEIELNHEVEVEPGAKIFFRGNDWSNIVASEGRKVVIDPDPKYALGAGQAVNIIGKGLRIKGDYLTDMDRHYIEAGRQLGIDDYMLSFVEREDDIGEVVALHPGARPVLKIESIKGLEYVANDYVPGHGHLMAARDDLLVNIGENKSLIIPALELIVGKDPEAIVASHLFTSLEYRGYVSAADISDVRMLKQMGYKNFMFSDGVSHRHFQEAVKAWNDYHQVCDK